MPKSEFRVLFVLDYPLNHIPSLMIILMQLFFCDGEGDFGHFQRLPGTVPGSVLRNGIWRCSGGVVDWARVMATEVKCKASASFIVQSQFLYGGLLNNSKVLNIPVSTHTDGLAFRPSNGLFLRQDRGHAGLLCQQCSSHMVRNWTWASHLNIGTSHFLSVS